MTGFSEVFDDFVTYKPSAVSALKFERELGANDIPPVFVFEPLAHSYTRPQQVGPFYGVTGRPKPLFTKGFRFDVHCWGATIDDAERLEAMAITILRKSSRCNANFTGSRWTQPKWAQYGVVITLSVETLLTLLESDLLWPGGNKGMLTAAVEHMELDQTGASDHDKIIQAGET